MFIVAYRVITMKMMIDTVHNFGTKMSLVNKELVKNICSVNIFFASKNENVMG